MKNFIYLTLFPQFFHNYFQISIAQKAIQRKIVKEHIYDLRHFASQNRVDDSPYGGGGGMLLKIEPLVRALSVIQEKHPNSHVLLLSAQGKIFTQKEVSRLNKNSNLVFVCGRYEGFDERIWNFVDEVISVGKFITMGGEIPALLLTDALIRAIPNVIKAESYWQESFTQKNGGLDYDNYTRPAIFEGFSVPEILLSGNHTEIKEWRLKNAKKKSQNKNYQNKKKTVLDPNRWRIKLPDKT